MSTVPGRPVGPPDPATAGPPSVQPPVERVRELAAQGKTVIPLSYSFIEDCETPVSAFLKLRGGGPAFLLESAEQGMRFGRWSFIGVKPRALIVLKDGELTVDGEQPDSTTRTAPSPRCSKRYVPADAARAGPAAVHRRRDGPVRLRPRALRRAARRAEPGSRRHARHGAHDHRRAGRLRPHQASRDHHLQRLPRHESDEGRRRRRRLRRRRRRRSTRSASSSPAPLPAPAPRAGHARVFESNIGDDGYASAVDTIKEYVRAGDAYQVVPAQRWSGPCPVDPFSIYRGIRAINPSPYMYFLEFDDFHIAGGSPEPLVKVTDRHAEYRPIAGTRPRAEDAAGDAALGGRAAGRREGTRRARDARRPRPQRPRAASASTAASRSTT